MNSRALRASKLTAVCLAALVVLFGNRVLAEHQSNSSPVLWVTPSTVVVLVGEGSALSAVDETGRAVSQAQWSINPAIADLHQENGQVFVEGKEAGRAVLTATVSNQSATAIVSVVAREQLAGVTMLWSLQPMPGYQTLRVLQAVPTSGSPDFYSIEWSASTNAIVRALNSSGQQIWMTHLASKASPLSLQHILPRSGQVFQNDAVVSDHGLFIIGPKSGFAQNNATDPSFEGLPVDGKSMLLRVSGDDDGGLMLLERGRFRDSFVDLSPTDGSEVWRYSSEGRLVKNWTVNRSGDVGIVETLAKPASSALLILSGKTGQVRFRIPFSVSSSTVDGYPCQDPQHNVLKSLRPAIAGSVFTSSDGNIYIQVETHVESLTVEGCKSKRYSFDERLALLRVTPEGETDWKTFQHIHADGEGDMVAQPRAFAGESIPDGFGGVLAAWTYLSPDTKGGQIRSEARLSRIGPSGQRDYTLPMPYWTKGLNSLFDANMVLGEGNFLYAINGPQLLRFDTQAGEVNWLRHPPTGEVKIQHATAGGGVLITNAGRLIYFDAQGNGTSFPWTVPVSNLEDIGLVQTDPVEHKAMEPMALRSMQFYTAAHVIAVEDGAPYGRGGLLYFLAQ